MRFPLICLTADRVTVACIGKPRLFLPGDDVGVRDTGFVVQGLRELYLLLQIGCLLGALLGLLHVHLPLLVGLDPVFLRLCIGVEVLALAEHAGYQALARFVPRHGHGPLREA